MISSGFSLINFHRLVMLALLSRWPDDDLIASQRGMARIGNTSPYAGGTEALLSYVLKWPPALPGSPGNHRYPSGGGLCPIRTSNWFLPAITLGHVTDRSQWLPARWSNQSESRYA